MKLYAQQADMYYKDRYLIAVFTVSLAAGGLCPSLSIASEPTETGAVPGLTALGSSIQDFKMIKPLADSGDAKAMALLGSLYFDGRGVEQNYNKAKVLWEKAAAAGDPVGMCALGLMLESGLAGPIERKRAVNLFENAARLGSGRAQYLMGLECLRGGVIKQDYSRAFAYLQASAKAGNGNAECLMAWMDERGLGAA